ncbi:uncharacterized protein LOC131980513 [Centropristis striata]|uniref:uncharacterized protein LOC131980513 n=1 Tax=Centropristis striata TaxID=184440 RepID=UPI0027E073D2|nr:uncharacterized protein LOC131980513 [Centropristis striata]
MCNRMVRRGRRRSATVYLAAAVILTCYLAQTIDCYRLKKTERREGRKEADAAKTIRVQEGRILFGKVFETGSGLEPQDIDGTKKSNASEEDRAAYQADSTGWSKGQTQDPSSKDASWKRMAPSLQCGGDQLKFRAVGPGASHFAVEQGHAPPMPLSQVPSTCGYNMQKNSLGLAMMVPYDGCNMVQEGGSYVLPMRWQGIPVSLWCPKPTTPAAQVPQTLLVPRTSKHPDDSDHHHQDHFIPPLPNYYQYPMVPKNPEMPQVPQSPWNHGFYPFPPLPVTVAPTTTAKPVPVYYPPFPFPWLQPMPTTAKPTTTKAQLPPLPPYFPYPFYPLYPTPKPTTTTTKTQTPHVHLPFPPYPFFPPYPYPTPKPTTATTTTTTQPPHTHPYLPFPPYPLFPPYPYPTPKPTTAATTTTTTQPPHTHPHVHLPFPPYHPLFPLYPTPKPTTTTKKTTTHTHPHVHPPYGWPFPFPPSG